MWLVRPHSSVCIIKSVKKFQRSRQENKKPFGANHQYTSRGRTNKVTATNEEQKLPGEMDELQLFIIGGISFCRHCCE